VWIKYTDDHSMFRCWIFVMLMILKKAKIKLQQYHLFV